MFETEDPAGKAPENQQPPQQQQTYTSSPVYKPPVYTQQTYTPAPPPQYQPPAAPPPPAAFQPPAAPPPMQVVVPEHPKKGMCVASLVLGIVSVVFGCFIMISLPCGVIGLILGIVAYRAQRNGMALAGIITSSVGLVYTIYFAFIFAASMFAAMADVFGYFSGSGLTI